ncbi:hypothetical protein H4N49_01145 [Streptomyces sp. DHE17-7]|nr:hypothetical protein [Streptomyces sp. DHE17-7]
MPTTPARTPASSKVSRTPVATTGCALTSTNTRKPSASSARVAASNSTVPRRLRYQYEPSRTAVSIASPVTVE